MNERGHDPSGSSARFFARRYRIEELIGQGGMAAVYRVFDSQTRRQLALKQLLAPTEEKKRKQIGELFEHEYHVLAQMAHPRVIAVYDYGLSETGPYYTMELLDGGDLKELAPLPWKTTCSYLYDVCSALSLIHSRRQVHRDLTPRNIRCTRDGQAKLIDFGAMVPMGACKQVVGTAPFTAPEALYFQPLDGRVDLYALGATGYYALTGHHAYPAKNFKQLRNRWRTVPRPPSSFVEGIPKELDRLILSLLNLDRMARPGNAAEVMERLQAIAGIAAEEQLLVPQSYLFAPTLVGRDAQLIRIRKQVIRAMRRRGGCFFVDGASGTGRTRFLDACALEGRLAGATVLRADAGDSTAGRWGAARAVLMRLMDEEPERVSQASRPHLPVLGHLFPELVERCTTPSIPPQGEWVRFPSFPPFPDPATGGESQPDDDRQVGEAAPPPLLAAAMVDPRTEVWGRSASWRPPPPADTGDFALESFDNPAELRPRVQKALRELFLKVCQDRFLVLVIDDIHRIDDPSAAFFALLVYERQDEMLMVVATAESDAPAVSTDAVRLLSQAGSSIKLRNLAPEDTERLLGSIFGEVDNLKLLANRVYSVSQGNPRTILQLAQSLVDRGAVRYRAGAWTLPERIDHADLPVTLTDALAETITGLDPGARRLATTIALSPERGFTFDECATMGQYRQTADLVRDLDQLFTFGVLATDGERYALSQQSWGPALLAGIDESAREAGHLRLAEVLEARADEPFNVVRHLLRAGEGERALERWGRFIEEHRARFEQNAQMFTDFLLTLPRDWMETFLSLRRLQQQLNRPRGERFWLDHDCLQYSVVDGSTDKELLREMLERLYRLSGLAILHQQQDAGDPLARLTAVLQQLQRQHDQSPDAEQVLPPGDAIRYLAQDMVLGVLLAGTAYDHEVVASMPSLQPLFPLSPALEVVATNVRITCDLTAGRYDRALQGYRQLLERVCQEDRAGLDVTQHAYVRLSLLYAVGVLEASFGIASALERADRIASFPLFEVNAARIRMQYYLSTGDAQQAKNSRKAVDLLRIQNSPTQLFEGGLYFAELVTSVISEELIYVKQLMPELEKMAGRFETWVPVLRFAQGEYQRIRGDFTGALEEFVACLAMVEAGRHVVWPRAAGSYLLTLRHLDRLPQAREQGWRLVEDAERVGLRIADLRIREALALVEAELGAYSNAIQLCDSMFERCEELGASGLLPGLSHETRARVALAMRDDETFQIHSEACAQHFRVGSNPALTARFEKLLGEARQSELLEPEAVEAVSSSTSMMTTASLVSEVAQSFTDCHGPQERAEQALIVIARLLESPAGFLYVLKREGPVISARTGSRPLPAELDAMVRDYLSAEVEQIAGETPIDEEVLTSMGDGDESAIFTCGQGERYYPLLLNHPLGQRTVVTGLAVLLLAPDQKVVPPSETVAAVSRALLDAGDVTVYYAAG